MKLQRKLGLALSDDDSVCVRTNFVDPPETIGSVMLT